jgi:GxxExxY protein
MNRQDAKDAKTGPGEELDRLAHEVIGAAIEVHRTLGPGFLEGSYESALAIELGLRDVSFQTQVPVPLRYKGHAIGRHRLDFVVASQLIVELKAVESLAPLHKAQIIAYLRTTGYTLGLLINNVPVLKDGIHRIILSS